MLNVNLAHLVEKHKNAMIELFDKWKICGLCNVDNRKLAIKAVRLEDLLAQMSSRKCND